MTAYMRPEDWLRFTQTEYLSDFISAGGSSIKFAVPMDEQAHAVLAKGLIDAADNSKFLIAELDALETRIHMVDQVFFRLSEQIAWDRLAERVLADLARELGYVVPDIVGNKMFESLADENGLDGNMVLMELKRKVSERVFQHRKLAKDFRVAMSQICIARLGGGDEGVTTIQVITDWLTGRNKSVTAVKPYQIFNRINRNNARHLLESMLRWLGICGHPGLLITLDARRLTLAKNPKDGKVFYTKPAVLDAYEVLRQFIDATDRLKGCLIVVIPAVEFLDVDPSGRGLGVYEALKFRIFDEIRDRNYVNPMASLVRLSSTATEVSLA